MGFYAIKQCRAMLRYARGSVRDYKMLRDFHQSLYVWPSVKRNQSFSSSTPTSSAPPLIDPHNTTVTFQEVIDAYDRIKNHIDITPLDLSHYMSDNFDCKLFLKKEHISRTGSYKERGALNKILLLSDEEKAKGVVCSSAGNHAQAVSYHSKRLGINSVIVMPETTPHVKVQSTRDFGGRVVLYGESYDEAFQKAHQIAEAEGRTFVHAFNDKSVVAGQGTVAFEMLKQNPYLDAIIVPVGGGGLIAGMSVVIKHVNPRIKIIGVESESMPGMGLSLKAGVVTAVPKARSISDGIAIESIGEVPFAVSKNLVDHMVTVNEAEVSAAILMMLEKEKTVVEGSGATGIAAIAYEHIEVKDKQVACILTGSNIDMSLLSRIIEKGLVQDKRIARISVTIEDTPGKLNRVLSVIAKAKANIRDIDHERAFLLESVLHSQPCMTLDTRGAEHTQEVVAALEKEGFVVQILVGDQK